MPYILKAEELESRANKVTTLSGDVTNDQYPSAKAVKDAIDNIDVGGSVPSIEVDQRYDSQSENPQSGIAVKQATISNEPLNNKKINDENNKVGYKGYKMLTYNLSEDKKTVDVELRDAELEEKARDKYVIGDLVNIDASTHSYQHQKITAITTNDTTGNTVLTLKEVRAIGLDDSANIQVDDSVNLDISFKLETLSSSASEEKKKDFENKENWLWVAGKSYGEIIPMFSHAIAAGINSKAVGWGAFATGRNCNVYGNYGNAIGRNNLAAFSATSVGLETRAVGVRSFSTGYQTLAAGDNSVAVGYRAYAIGPSAFSEGSGTKASGECSHSSGTRTTASGLNSYAGGQDTNATGDNSIALGNNTGAWGENSTSFGDFTLATKKNSFAIGSGTQAKGENSFAGGVDTIASSNKSFAFGASIDGIHTQANAEGATAFGIGNIASGYSSFAIGFKTSASGASSLASGVRTKAVGEGSHSSGERTNANGKNSVAIGGVYRNSNGEEFEVYAKGENSFAAGAGTEASDTNSVAFGRSSKAKASQSFATGTGTTASGDSSASFGTSTTASGWCSLAQGCGTTANTSCQAVFGQYNDTNANALLIVGNGENTSSKSNAFTVNSDGTATVQTNPANPMDVATKGYVDILFGVGTSLPTTITEDSPKFFVVIE